MSARNRISFETVGSIVAIVVGVVALFVAWDEAKSVRKQQAASVLPIVKIFTSYTTTEMGHKSAVIVQNVGVGPAFIENARIIWDGTQLQDVRSGLAVLPGANDLVEIWTSPLYGEIMSGNDEYEMFSAIMPSEKVTAEYISSLKTSINRNLIIEACFCSVYEECWTTNLNSTIRPQPIKSCAADF
ncbi:hypothetical protein [Parvularcula sp. IMCC14364]|uniref:hypothetical protein n=1 Tax=Parvularcula sp. IMCC14364 TaxID=3067902 RepID=UPI0027417682|nr:hypothetical protein [Parvularcula sp. IMCC14364]